jgi:hypothetical protein
MIGSHLTTHHSISQWDTFWHPKQMNQPRRLQTRHRAPLKDSWGVAEPWFGTMADVAMAIWGKDAGGRAAAAHLVYVGCVGTQNQPPKTWKFLSRRKMLFSYVNLYPLRVKFLCDIWLLGVLLCTIKNIPNYIITCAKTLHRFLWCAGISGTFCIILVTFPQ